MPSEESKRQMDEQMARDKKLLAKLVAKNEQWARDAATRTTRLHVNKKTHRIRFENETEDSVDVVFEPKGIEQGGP